MNLSDEKVEKKMTLESSKNLGGIGAILMFIGVLPYVNYFSIVEIIGAIFILVALHGFARFYKESGIFNNAIYGIITGIVGVVLAAVIAIVAILSNIKDFLLQVFPSWNGNWSTIPSLSGMTPNTSNISFGDIIPFIIASIVVIVIIWVFGIVGTFFIRRSLMQLSAKTNIGLFSTAGLMLLIGAALAIIFGVGLFVTWIGVLVLAYAFFRIKP
jgi:uncharacterized membrane protein